MKNATFYILDNNICQDDLCAAELLACELAAKYWRSGKRILIACEDEQHAVRLDKALWERPLESFIPHNLASKGPRYSAPIELAWMQEHNNNQKDLLISLRIKFTAFATSFIEVIDFVPYESSLKQLARERYKAYRTAGFNLSIAIWK